MSWIGINVSISDVVNGNEDEILEHFSDNDIKEEAEERGLINPVKLSNDNDLSTKQFKELICDRYGVSHYTAWKELINNIESEVL